MKIGLASGFADGSTWYRLLLPQKALNDVHDFSFSPCIVETRDGTLALLDQPSNMLSIPDVLVFQRWSYEDAEPAIRRARANGQTIIADIDDWYWGIPTDNVAFYATHKRTSPTTNREHYRKVLSACSGVIASTPYLAERLQDTNPRTFVWRNHIDIDRWISQKPRDTDRLYIGWHIGLPWRSTADPSVLRGIIGPWLEAHPNVTFVHCGYMDSQEQHLSEVMGIPAWQYEERDAKNISMLPELLQGIDVGLAVLSDSPFNRCKSWLKPLELGAAGIPCIGSRFPEYEAFGEGLLCRRPKDWVRAFDVMLNVEARSILADGARDRAESLSIDVGAPLWSNVVQEIASL